MINFVVNEKSSSGNGKNVWIEVQKILSTQNVEYKCWVTERPGHATELAGQICQDSVGDVDIVVIGGDGTINEIVNGITDFDRVRLGVIPTGSGNDFARGIGILGGNIESHVERVLNCKNEYRIDLGKVTYGDENKTKLFAISSGVGMDALVCKKVESSSIKKTLNKLHLGKFTYIIITIQSLFTMACANAKCKFDGKEKRYKKLVFMAAMNFSAEGGGVPMAPKADAADGKISICACAGVSKLGAFLRLPFLMMRKHENLKCFDVFDIASGKVLLSQPMALHTDGEYLGDITKVEYECLEKKLRFLL